MAWDTIAEIGASGQGGGCAVCAIFQPTEEAAEPPDAKAQQQGKHQQIAAASRYAQALFGEHHANEAAHDGFVGEVVEPAAGYASTSQSRCTGRRAGPRANSTGKCMR